MLTMLTQMPQCLWLACKVPVISFKAHAPGKNNSSSQSQLSISYL